MGRGGRRSDLANGARASPRRRTVFTFRIDPPAALGMDSGAVLAPLTIAYQTYGALNAAKSNALLICHALTGDQHVANPHPVTGRPGLVGDDGRPGRPFDTNRFFVICSNVLGGCMGSTGPAVDQPRKPASPTGSTFRSSRSPTWCAPRRC